ncbi:hypothetical protein ATO3_08300 [Marinibacterium profundimaris]|uniref:Chemoreceptor zinc-binding domain-containing protein n=2 Tax=Marinibacterium profundimaris TaxID=1679460 RepID=A0A225NKM1_9RHOB|nr:hypothetical protein ATO3_08300 [Marinibacterium profundimaris]
MNDAAPADLPPDTSILRAGIEDALADHNAMKQRLRNATRGGLLPGPALAISSEDTCRFGRWLQRLKQLPAIARSPHFRAVVTAHGALHRAAGHVARLIEDGQRDRATEELDGEAYRGAAGVLIAELEAWQRSL